MMRKPSRRKLSTCSLVSTPLPYPRVGDLSEASLEDFLDAVGEDTPAPGGGTSSAITTALAAALVEMAARLASDEDAGEEGAGEERADEERDGEERADEDANERPAARARKLRAEALRLAEEELTSYAPVLEAETPADRTTALDAASEPPAQIAEAAAAVAELGIEVAGASSPEVRGDALTGVVLAEGAAAAAARLVETNITSGPVFDRARKAAKRAADARRRCAD
jgi:formiminotetrahydrofolate cyclodeaminase